MTRVNPILKAAVVHFGQCVQASLMYRSSLAIFLATESIAYAGFIAFWYKAAASNLQQTTYTGMGLAAYFATVSFHHAIQDQAASRDIGGDIRLGKLSYALIKPFPYLLSVMVRCVAYTLTKAMLVFPLFLAAMIWVPGLWSSFSNDLVSAHLWQYPMALGLAVVSSMITRIVVGMMAFDMSQIWGPDTMLIALYYATSGSVFPIDLAPAWLHNIAIFTPTYYMTGFPTLVFLGRIDQATFLQQWSHGAFVCLALFTVMQLMWARGIKKFEAIGI